MRFLLGCLLVVQVLSGSYALGAEGIARLFLPGFNAGYELEFKETIIAGTFFNNGYSSAKLVYKDGSWKGIYGRMNIVSTSVKTMPDATIEVQVVSMPGGTSYFTLKTLADGALEITGLAYNAWTTVEGKLTANSDKFSLKSSYTNISLSQKNSLVHLGSMNVKNAAGVFYTGAELRAAGGMAVNNAKQDPALFVLLHVIPFL